MRGHYSGPTTARRRAPAEGIPSAWPGHRRRRCGGWTHGRRTGSSAGSRQAHGAGRAGQHRLEQLRRLGGRHRHPHGRCVRRPRDVRQERRLPQRHARQRIGRRGSRRAGGAGADAAATDDAGSDVNWATSAASSRAPRAATRPTPASPRSSPRRLDHGAQRRPASRASRPRSWTRSSAIGSRTRNGRGARRRWRSRRVHPVQQNLAGITPSAEDLANFDKGGGPNILSIEKQFQVMGIETRPQPYLDRIEALKKDLERPAAAIRTPSPAWPARSGRTRRTWRRTSTSAGPGLTSSAGCFERHRVDAGRTEHRKSPAASGAAAVVARRRPSRARARRSSTSSGTREGSGGRMSSGPGGTGSDPFGTRPGRGPAIMAQRAATDPAVEATAATRSPTARTRRRGLGRSGPGGGDEQGDPIPEGNDPDAGASADPGPGGGDSPTDHSGEEPGDGDSPTGSSNAGQSGSSSQADEVDFSNDGTTFVAGGGDADQRPTVRPGWRTRMAMRQPGRRQGQQHLPQR